MTSLGEIFPTSSKAGAAVEHSHAETFVVTWKQRKAVLKSTGLNSFLVGDARRFRSLDRWLRYIDGAWLILLAGTLGTITTIPVTGLTPLHRIDWLDST